MKKYKINPSTTIGKAGNLNVIGTGSKQYLVNDNDFNDTVKVLSFLLACKTENEIDDFLKKNKIQENIFKELLINKMVTTNPNLFEKKDTVDFKNNLYLELVSKDSNTVLKNVREYIILIIGCGGIGNYMSYALSTLSPKKMYLIDGDKVENSNLNRQILFSKSDIGLYKSETIKRELLKKNPDLNIECISEYANKELFEKILSNIKSDEKIIGILSGDTIAAVEDTASIFGKYKIPYLNIGYLNDLSVIGPFYIPGKSCCPYCHNDFAVDVESSKEIDIINEFTSTPASFLNNALSSSLGMSDLIFYFDDELDKIKSLNTRIGINNMTFEKLTVHSSIDKHCKYCSTQEKF